MIFDNSEGKHDLIAEKTMNSEIEILNLVPTKLRVSGKPLTGR